MRFQLRTLDDAWVIFGTKAIVEHALLKKTCTSLCKARLQCDKALVLRGIHLLWSPKRLQWHEFCGTKKLLFVFLFFLFCEKTHLSFESGSLTKSWRLFLSAGLAKAVGPFVVWSIFQRNCEQQPSKKKKQWLELTGRVDTCDMHFMKCFGIAWPTHTFIENSFQAKLVFRFLFPGGRLSFLSALQAVLEVLVNPSPPPVPAQVGCHCRAPHLT